MKKYKVILTESEMRKLNEVRRDVRAKRLVADDIDTKDEDEFITVDHIDKNNYKKYIGKKVNVTGDVYLEELGLKEIPITFGKVGGNFDCSDNEFKFLVGCPSEVGGDFKCKYNRLTSLKGCPRKVGGIFDCSHNNKEFTENDVSSLCEIDENIYV